MAVSVREQSARNTGQGPPNRAGRARGGLWDFGCDKKNWSTPRLMSSCEERAGPGGWLRGSYCSYVDDALYSALVSIIPTLTCHLREVLWLTLGPKRWLQELSSSTWNGSLSGMWLALALFVHEHNSQQRLHYVYAHLYGCLCTIVISSFVI